MSGAWSEPRWRPLSEGWAILAGLTVGAVTIGRLIPGARSLLALLGVGVALALRDPDRSIDASSGVVLAAADGRVMGVRNVWDEHLGREMLEITTFLSLWNVHVQRSPLPGTIVDRQQFAGYRRAALRRSALESNFRVATHLETAFGPCTVVQVAGLVARRIVTWPPAGSRLAAGERIGMIKFGSQTAIRVASSAKPLVSPGQQVRAGLTPVATFN